MKKTLLSGLVKASGNEYAGGINACSVYTSKYYVDTGNYILNALISGDIYKGIPSGMIVQWAGDKSTGKSFLTQNIALNHVKSGSNHLSLIIETEGALQAEPIMQYLTEDEQSRFIIFPCRTIEEIKVQANKIVEYVRSKLDEFKDTEILVTLDSIGMPASQKEKNDAIKDNAPRDMTRAQAIKSLFRTIAMEFFLLKIPMNLVNHTYATMDMFAPKAESGGTGVAYSNSVTLIMNKKKLRDKNKVQVGTVFTLTPTKSRVVAENISKIELYSKFKIGMDKYTGLWEFVKNHKLITSVGNGPKGGSTITFKDLNLVYQSKEIEKIKPEDFWDKKKLDYINAKFKEMYLLDRAEDKSVEEILAED